MRVNRTLFLLYRRWIESVQTRSSLPAFLACRSRYWRIRIDPTPLRHSGDPDPPGCVGLGFVTMGLWFLLIFLEFLLCTPLFLLPEPLCALIFLQKILKKLLCVSWWFLIVLWHFYMFKIDKKICALFFLWICVLCVSFVKFLAWLLIQFFAIWRWYLALDFMICLLLNSC